MAKVRLRPKYSPEELKEVYASQYDHTRWTDHVERIKFTINFSVQNLPTPVYHITDLSCGDAAIAKGIAESLFSLGDTAVPPSLILGDFVEGYDYQGVIEDTINEISNTDLFILSETLEHLDNPEYVLSQIRKKTSYLVLSTPCNETLGNPEHYWKWGTSDVALMLEEAGFTPIAFSYLEFPELDVRYQLWMVK